MLKSLITKLITVVLITTLVIFAHAQIIKMTTHVNIVDAQSKVSNCIATKSLTKDACLKAIGIVDSWKPSAGASPILLANNIRLKCLLARVTSSSCSNASKIVSNWNNIQASYTKVKNNVAAIAEAINFGIGTGSLKVNNSSYTGDGKRPLKVGSIISTMTGDVVIPQDIVAYLDYSSSPPTFCVSETSPDKVVTWVGKGSEMMLGIPCTQA